MIRVVPWQVVLFRTYDRGNSQRVVSRLGQEWGLRLDSPRGFPLYIDCTVCCPFRDIRFGGRFCASVQKGMDEEDLGNERCIQLDHRMTTKGQSVSGRTYMCQARGSRLVNWGGGIGRVNQR